MVTTNRLSWMIGGPQGSGVDSSARMFALACANSGLNVFGKREYYSNIKGEHSYFQIRIDEREIRSSIDAVHVLATFEAETIVRHVYAGEVVPGGCVILDPKDLEVKLEAIGTLDPRLRAEITKDLTARGKDLVVRSIIEDAKVNGVKVFLLPYQDLLQAIGEEIGVKEHARLLILRNTVAVGASFGVLGYDLGSVKKTVEDIFGSKSEKIKKMNRVAIEKAYDFAKENFGTIDWTLTRPKQRPKGKRLFIQGAQAVALGKIAAGCRLQTYYPITPATDESEFLESHPDGRVVVVQAEDEIAAIAMAIGGALTGTRSSTSTSGPGFNLMVEAAGWAGINEVPLVIVDYQRGGPSTGLPTRHEQGDLKFALNSGHGDYPRFVYAPGDVEESFFGALDCFNWAEKYQTVAILLSDKNLANNNTIVAAFDVSKAKVERGALATEEELVEATKDDFHFHRFALTDNGVSKRAFLGQKGGIHWLTGDEHTEQGHITEDPDLRMSMMRKRMNKEVIALAEIPAEKKYTLFGPSTAPVTIVSWGSTKGAILDALDRLKEEGIECNFLQVKLMWPFPAKEIEDLLKDAKIIVNIEQNYTAQFGKVLRQETGILANHNLLKYNGRPMTEDEIVRGVKRLVNDKVPQEVLTYGV